VRAERATAPATANTPTTAKAPAAAKAPATGKARAKTPAPAAGQRRRAGGAKRNGKSQNAAAGQVKLEAQIEVAEAALRSLEDELADPGAWSSPEVSAKSAARHERAKRALQQLYERWEAVAG
jgi:ATP-binding cassette subfamily F protein 3